jgi:hypothetical protein
MKKACKSKVNSVSLPVTLYSFFSLVVVIFLGFHWALLPTLLVQLLVQAPHFFSVEQ